MKKNIFYKIIISMLFPLVFFSCQFFENDVADYMETYTETAAIENHSFSVNTYYDSLNHLNLSSSEEVSVELYMRNPKRFNMQPSVLFPKLGENFNRSSVVINQISSDTVLLKLPQEFLIPIDEGKDISSEISLYEPMSGRTFNKYYISLYCNSIPPDILNPTVINKNNSSFVLAFDMPNEEDAAIRHKDLNEIVINGVSYPVSVTTESDSEGIKHAVYNFTDSHFTRSWNSSFISINQKAFVHTRNSVYFDTGETFDASEKEYTIILKDKAGLSSTVKASTRITKLQKPKILNQNGSIIPENSLVGIPFSEETGKGSVTIIPPSKDHLGNDVSAATVYYKIYEATGSGLIYSSGSTSSNLTLELPQNTYRMEAYASLLNYETSATNTVKFRFINNNIFIKEGAANGDGSETAPYASFTEAINDINGRENKLSLVTINLEGNLNEDIVLSANINADSVIIKKNPAAASASIKSLKLENTLPASFPVTAIGFTISNNAGNGISHEGANSLSLENMLVEGCSGSGISLSANSKLTLSAATIKNNSNGGVIVNSGAQFNISGNNVIQNNTKTGSIAANVCLAAGIKINVLSELTQGCRIGVTTDSSEEPASIGDKYSFTQGYGLYNSGSPSTFFISDKNFSIIKNGSEAGVCLTGASGNLLNIADQYSFSFPSIQSGGSGLSSVYTGSENTVLVSQDISLTNTSPATTLYCNFADKELYTDSAHTVKHASGIKVSYSASIYNYNEKVMDIPSENIRDGGNNKIEIIIPQLNYNGQYLLKICANYLEKDHVTEKLFEANRSVTTVLNYIENLPAGRKTVCVEGSLSNTELELIASKINASASFIDLDLTNTTTNLGQLLSFNMPYFLNKTRLTSIKLPQWYKSINTQMFSGCTALESVQLPSSVEFIGNKAFEGCTSLTSITLPQSLAAASSTGLGETAFKDCTNIQNIYFTGTKEQWKAVKRVVASGKEWNTGIPAGVEVTCVDGSVAMDEVSYAGGLKSWPASGTYSISSVADLKNLADLVESNTDYPDTPVEFNLTQDLIVNEYICIKYFKGKFNGNDHVIDMNDHFKNTAEECALFNKIKDSEIKNVKIKGSSGHGSLINEMEGNSLVDNCISATTITYVSVTGIVDSATEGAGGIVCKMHSGTIRNCINEGSVNFATSNQILNIGGIVGNLSIKAAESPSIIIENCVNRGEVRARFYSGGIVGRVNDEANLPRSGNPPDIVIRNCKNIGTINSIASYGGGIVGFIQKVWRMDIINCCNNGTLSNYCGGIVGRQLDPCKLRLYGNCNTYKKEDGDCTPVLKYFYKQNASSTYVNSLNSEYMYNYVLGNDSEDTSEPFVPQNNPSTDSATHSTFVFNFSNEQISKEDCVKANASDLLIAINNSRNYITPICDVLKPWINKNGTVTLDLGDLDNRTMSSP
ncbi:MAG: leucine-rich repeat protein [Treponema sp.]|nr:leucine-rich repeat protein [Treponema sp.]